MIEQRLIEKALALTGKTMEYMNIKIWWDFDYWYEYDFSIEKFWWYLLSKPFITKQKAVIHWAIHKFALAIHEYQEWDDKHLKELLEKV